MGASEYVQNDLSKLMESSNELLIANGLFNEDGNTSLNITNNRELKRIEIGGGCFGNVREFELDGLSELESVVIGQSSFRISDKERNDGSYRIVNCPKLKSIQIGNRSFYDYHSFELSNLPSLQSIEFGSECFYSASSFSLIGIIERMN